MVMKNEHVQQHWNGEYFGPKGSVATASLRYELSFCYDDDQTKGNAAIGYVSTLYSALIHCVAQLKRFRVGCLRHAFRVFFQLSSVVSRINHECMVRNFDSSQKEVLMATLIVLLLPSYRKMAVEIGEEVLKGKDLFGELSSVDLLVCGRLSRIHPVRVKRRVYYGAVWIYVYFEHRRITLDWKTVSRLARLIGDKEMAQLAAKMDGSPDVILKSGL